MNVLVVDDEFDKVQQIAEALRIAALGDVVVQHQSTAHAARQILRTTAFDLLLIDLNLPDGVNDKPSKDGGINLFDMLCLDDSVRLPTDVAFITALQEPLGDLHQRVLERGATLWHYKGDDLSWKSALVGRVKYICKRLLREKTSRKVDIAIITALHSPELAAVLALPYKWSFKRVDGDPTGYHFGEFSRVNGHVISVVAAHAQRKGMPSSAALASKLAYQFKPQYLVMTGICAGIEGKTNIGDVIVADPTWDYGSGKRALDSVKSPVFKSAPYQMPLDTTISQLARELGRDAGVLREMRSGWTHAVPQGVLSVHVGPMASGGSVIADDGEARKLVLQHKDLLAIEMEAYAVMAAVEYAGMSKPIAVAIKSVCDFADAVKNDDWQTYASYTSANFADRLFRSEYFKITR
jgi:nucleoside phosphorylase